MIVIRTCTGIKWRIRTQVNTAWTRFANSTLSTLLEKQDGSITQCELSSSCVCVSMASIMHVLLLPGWDRAAIEWYVRVHAPQSKDDGLVTVGRSNFRQPTRCGDFIPKDPFLFFTNLLVLPVTPKFSNVTSWIAVRNLVLLLTRTIGFNLKNSSDSRSRTENEKKQTEVEK